MDVDLSFLYNSDVRFNVIVRVEWKTMRNINLFVTTFYESS